MSLRSLCAIGFAEPTAIEALLSELDHADPTVRASAAAALSEVLTRQAAHREPVEAAPSVEPEAEAVQGEKAPPVVEDVSDESVPKSKGKKSKKAEATE